MKTRLSDLYTLQMGKTPSRNVPEYWQEGTYQWASVSDLNREGKYLSKTREQITETAVEQSGIKEVPANTVVMSFKLSLGKVAITRKSLFTNEAIMAFIPKDKRAPIAEYLFYQLQCHDWAKESANRAVMGATLNKASLSKVEVTVPPKPEQERVTEHLRLLDAQLLSCKITANKLDELVKSRFIEMFGNSASGEFDGQAAKLGSILRKPASNGFFARKSDYVDSGNAGVIGVTNVVNRLYSGIENLPRANATQRDIEKYELSYGDMLFCRSSLVPEGVGKASVVPPDVQPGTLFECHVIRLPLDLEKCLPEFMQIQTSMMMFRRQVMAKAKTSTMTTIDQKSLLDCVVNLPPIEKQETFLVFLNQINKLRFDSLAAHMIMGQICAAANDATFACAPGSCCMCTKMRFHSAKPHFGAQRSCARCTDNAGRWGTD